MADHYHHATSPCHPLRVRVPIGHLVEPSLPVGVNRDATRIVAFAVVREDAATRGRKPRPSAEVAGRVRNAVEEFLRLTTPVQGLARTTTRDVEIAGRRIPAGRKVLLLYASANRDEAEFGASAEDCDITRPIRHQLAFSPGPHDCIGAAAARLQARPRGVAHPLPGLQRGLGSRPLRPGSIRPALRILAVLRA